MGDIDIKTAIDALEFGVPGTILNKFPFLSMSCSRYVIFF